MTGRTIRTDQVPLLDAPPLARATGRALAEQFEHRSPGTYERWFKPLIDRVGAALLLVLFLPVMLAIAIAILVTLGRPIFFLQERIGRDGVTFRMIKFRTMHPDRRKLDAGFDGHDRRVTHKTEQDPRHTRIGRFLRRYSLDELPQLWNILRGDLSIIGPRPELKSVVERQYAGWQHARHAVRPGLTGLWQVTERDDEGQMYQHVDLDLRYIRALSALVDLRIALLTPAVILGKRLGDEAHDPDRIAPVRASAS